MVTKRKTTRKASKRNPAKTVSLRNFTGKIRLNPNKTVSVIGRGKRTKRTAKKRTATKRRKR